MNTPMPTILIVENDEGMLAALATRLRASGYRCVTASCGDEGAEEFTRHHPDMIVTDLNMPGGDGIDLVAAVRRSSDAPVLVLTGFVEDYKRSLRPLRNITIVRKPCPAADLIDLIESHLLLFGVDTPAA